MTSKYINTPGICSPGNSESLLETNIVSNYNTETLGIRKNISYVRYLYFDSTCIFKFQIHDCMSFRVMTSQRFPERNLQADCKQMEFPKPITFSLHQLETQLQLLECDNKAKLKFYNFRITFYTVVYYYLPPIRNNKSHFYFVLHNYSQILLRDFRIQTKKAREKV